MQTPPEEQRCGRNEHFDLLKWEVGDRPFVQIYDHDPIFQMVFLETVLSNHLRIYNKRPSEQGITDLVLFDFGRLQNENGSLLSIPSANVKESQFKNILDLGGNCKVFGIFADFDEFSDTLKISFSKVLLSDIFFS